MSAKIAENEPEEGKPVLSEEWWRVIAQRSAEYAAGRMKTVSWEEVQAKWKEPRPGGERPA